MGTLDKTDPEIAALIREEERYELETVRLIPSENYVSAGGLGAARPAGAGHQHHGAGPPPRRPPPPGLERHLLRPLLPPAAVQRRPEEPRHRLRRPAGAGARGTAADHRRRGHRLPAAVRLPGVRRDRQGGGRPPPPRPPAHPR